MNQKTRRLSKMPDEVRTEISPWFIEKKAIQEDSPEKIEKLDDNAKYVNSNLKVNYIELNFSSYVTTGEAFTDTCSIYQKNTCTLKKSA